MSRLAWGNERLERSHLPAYQPRPKIEGEEASGDGKLPPEREVKAESDAGDATESVDADFCDSRNAFLGRVSDTIMTEFGP